MEENSPLGASAANSSAAAGSLPPVAPATAVSPSPPPLPSAGSAQLALAEAEGATASAALSNAIPPSPLPSPKKTQLPHDYEAEKACLGAVINRHELYDEVFPKLHSNSFYDKRNQEISKALIELRRENPKAPFDLVILGEVLNKKKLLGKTGGYAYLNELIDSVPFSSHLKHYVNIVTEKHYLRLLIDILQGGIENAYAQREYHSFIEEVQQALFNLINQEYQGYEVLGEAIASSVELLETRIKTQDTMGISSGFAALDRIIVGFQAGNLITIGGRTGQGKTALALSMAMRMVSAGEIEGKRSPAHSVGFFSLEMSKNEICYRILSLKSSTPLKHFQTGDFHDDDWQRLLRTMDELKLASFYIDDTPGLGVDEFSSKVRKMVKDGVEIIVVDYLQLMTPSDTSLPREQQISSISKQIKQLARSLKIPIIALTQLNRLSDQRGDNEPRLSDIRESGAIEQDSDVVMFVQTSVPAGNKERGKKVMEDDLREEPSAESKKRATLFVAKNRHGATGKIPLEFEGPFTRFNDWDNF